MAGLTEHCLGARLTSEQSTPLAFSYVPVKQVLLSHFIDEDFPPKLFELTS